MANSLTPYSTTPPNNVPLTIWPSNLPSCPDSWSEQTQDLRVRTSMSVGPPKTRRRYTLPMRRVTLTMNIPYSDYVELRAFYEGSGLYQPGEDTGGTEGGYKFFRFKHPYDGEYHYYRFFAPPKFTNAGGIRVIVSMEWEEL